MSLIIHNFENNLQYFPPYGYLLIFQVFTISKNDKNFGIRVILLKILYEIGGDNLKQIKNLSISFEINYTYPRADLYLNAI